MYQEFFRTADPVAELATAPLDIPVRAVAPAAEGGVIDRCGHWAREERPNFVAGLVRDLAAA